MTRTRKKRSRPWDDQHMADYTGYSVETIHKSRVEGGFNYKELTMPYGTFAGEDTTPSPVAPPWMVTIPVAKLVCGNCRKFNIGADQCDYIVAQKTETSPACLHIWDYGNYLLVEWEERDAAQKVS